MEWDKINRNLKSGKNRGRIEAHYCIISLPMRTEAAEDVMLSSRFTASEWPQHQLMQL